MSNNSTLFRLAVFFLPLAIIASVIYLVRVSHVAERNLHTGTTYSVWLVEAEVAPLSESAAAPDLVGSIDWQGQVVLRTLTARNCLIARWDPIGLSVGQLLEGEVGTSSLQRVGRIRHSLDGKISVAVFAQGVFKHEFVGGVDVPLGQLKLGLNTIQLEGPLRRIQLAVADAEANGVLENHEWVVLEGVQVLQEAPASMQASVWPSGGKIDEIKHQVGQGLESLVKEASNSLNQHSDSAKAMLDKTLPEARKELDAAAKKVQDSGRAIKQWFDKIPSSEK